MRGCLEDGSAITGTGSPFGPQAKSTVPEVVHTRGGVFPRPFRQPVPSGRASGRSLDDSPGDRPTAAGRRERWLNFGILVAATLVGVVAFLSPFFSSAVQSNVQSAMAHAQDAPFVLGVLVVICLGAILANLTAGGINAKSIAVLGVLTAISATLRALPGPQGFNAIFFLPILAGYAYGATFGFLLGALALLTSALLGGGVGPWLPYQMFATGWMGLLSAAIPQRWLQQHSRLEVMTLAAWAFLLGLVFGAIMNLWFWPFVFQPGDSAMYWQPGMTWQETLKRYAVFYMVTSLGWDLWRAAGNALLILLFGVPILRLLRRFQRRFRFDVVSAPL